MPFELRVSFSAQYIDFDKYVGELQRGLRQLMRQTANLYYKALIFRLPVDTGFLAGSFAPIAKAAGFSPTSIVPDPKGQRRNIYTHFGNRRTPKNPSTGTEYVTSEDQILTEITDGETRLRLIFYFNNEIRYYPINDLYKGFSIGKGFTAQATRAAIAFLEANIDKVLPAAISKSILQQLISYRPGQPPQRIRVRS
jgi:hypothetical protein